MALLATILNLELRALGFVMPQFVAAVALGVWAVLGHMAMFVAAKAFHLWTGSLCGPLASSHISGRLGTAE